VIALVFKLVGGIGLFLLGMVLLTDGLIAFAGDALRRTLRRFTGTPRKAFASGPPGQPHPPNLKRIQMSNPMTPTSPSAT
jgi:hypothetical protein